MAKGKGSAFERKICVTLSLWVSNGTEKELFRRSQLSGGRSTVANKRGDGPLIGQVGDLSIAKPGGAPFVELFTVECKHYKSLELDTLFLSRGGKTLVFWKQALQQAMDAKNTPLLIAKQNYYPTIVISDSLCYEKLKNIIPVPRCIIPEFDIHLWELTEFTSVPFADVKSAMSSKKSPPRLKRRFW